MSAEVHYHVLLCRGGVWETVVRHWATRQAAGQWMRRRIAAGSGEGIVRACHGGECCVSDADVMRAAARAKRARRARRISWIRSGPARVICAVGDVEVCRLVREGRHRQWVYRRGADVPEEPYAAVRDRLPCWSWPTVAMGKRAVVDAIRAAQDESDPV